MIADDRERRMAKERHLPPVFFWSDLSYLRRRVLPVLESFAASRCRLCLVLVLSGCVLSAVAFASRASAGTLDAVVKDAEGRPVGDAVVYATGASRTAATKPAGAVIDQQDKEFVPRV